MITKKPGQSHKFIVTKNVDVIQQTYELIAKDSFRPKRAEGHWDATRNQLAWGNTTRFAQSLRALLVSVTEGVEAEEFRRIQYSVELPDLIILDSIQDEIFRLPFGTNIRIDGAPGTGKTTVLLKRLSQKTKREFLTDTELQVINDHDWNDGRNWMLFSPSDLLKAYIKEAMAKEALPASDEHVKVYRTFRSQTLREVGVIKVGKRGYLIVADQDSNFLKRDTGKEQIQLTKAFGEHLATSYAPLFNEAVQAFINKTRKPVSDLNEENQSVLLKALDVMTHAGTDPIEFRRAQARAAEFRKLNAAVKKVLDRIHAIGESLNREENIGPVGIYRYHRSWLELLGTMNAANMDSAVFPRIPPLIAELRSALKDLTDKTPLLKLYQLVPRAYQRFRNVDKVRDRFFEPDHHKDIKSPQICEAEQDVILYHLLEFAREMHGILPPGEEGVPGELRNLFDRFRLFITVDEATDFSPLEIACMERFAIPDKGGVTICGDLMQRVTQRGLKSWEDLDEICSTFAGWSLQTSYRQTERLFRIAQDLYAHVTGSEPAFQSAYPSQKNDPPALRFKPTKELPAATWLAERICNIHELCGDLPTTAILVATPEDVEPMRKRLAPVLHKMGMEVDAAGQGQNLGDSDRVRIFPVEHIKGLEFEAVFYADIDRMAEVHKDLIDKYVYVGLSRARSFLGVTYARQFPKRLECIAKHFEDGGDWSNESEAPVS